MIKDKEIKFTTKKYKVEKAPVGTRFINGSHSTLLIVTDGREISNLTKSVICVSESGLVRKILFGTEIECIKEAKDISIQLSRKIMNNFYK
jgi:hypothetical protein